VEEVPPRKFSTEDCTHKKEIMQLYDAAEEAVFPEGEKLLLICVNKTIEIEDEGYTLLDRVRYSWKISPRRAEKAAYVLTVARGLIIGVFENSEWMDATRENFAGDIPERYGNWDDQEGRSWISRPQRSRGC
jgi:hypothetical protein